LKILLELFPLPASAKVDSGDVVPPPRVIIRNEPAYNDEQVTDPLDEDEKFHTVTVRKNVRITAPDWYQDVRHIELDLGDEDLV
jgi:sulfite reductase alpha subunit-like flavoprotein